MRAVSYERYGSTAELHVVDVPVPSPGPGEVLVKVMATSVNLTDWECLHGSPLYARIGGLRSPANPILGSDIAGRIEAVGSGVTDFQHGDEVVADNLGTKGGFAEYAIVPVSALARKHADLSFAQASTLPQAGAIALQATAAVRPGQRVLINGGGGGTGPFAIQLAKRMGAVVAAVDNERKLDFMRSIGADEVIDYGVEDFTARGERYDLIIDLVAHRSPFAYLRALQPKGRYRWVGGSMPTLLGISTFGALAGLVTGRRVGVLAVREGPSHFGPLVDLCAAGEVTIVIDHEFGLDEVAEAVARVGEGRSLGKVVVQVG